MNIANNLKNPTVHGVSTTIIGAAAVYSALSVLGLGVITPWPAKADIDSVQQSIIRQQKQIDAILTQSQIQSCTMWAVLRDQYAKDLDEAKAEFAKTHSALAARARDAAETKVAQMNKNLSQAPCV